MDDFAANLIPGQQTSLCQGQVPIVGDFKLDANAPHGVRSCRSHGTALRFDSLAFCPSSESYAIVVRLSNDTTARSRTGHCSIIDGLVRQRPEIENEIRRNRRRKRALAHDDPDHFFRGIVVPRRTEPAVPAVLAGGCRNMSRCVTTHTPKPQPRLSQRPGKGDAAFCSAVR